MKALLNAENFRTALAQRAARFQKNYPRLVRLGWIALFAQPLATFVVMVLVHADVDTRVEMLVAMVIGIIVVDTYLIVISYFNTSLTHQLALANLSPTDLQAEAKRQLGPSISSTKEDSRGDRGCPDRASSAATESVQWTLSQSEDCLSESGYPLAPTSEEPPSEDCLSDSAYPVAPTGGEPQAQGDDGK